METRQLAGDKREGKKVERASPNLQHLLPFTSSTTFSRVSSLNISSDSYSSILSSGSICSPSSPLIIRPSAFFSPQDFDNHNHITTFTNSNPNSILQNTQNALPLQFLLPTRPTNRLPRQSSQSPHLRRPSRQTAPQQHWRWQL